MDRDKTLALLALLELLLNRTIPRLGFLATTYPQYLFFKAVEYAGLLALSALLIASLYVAITSSRAIGAVLIAALAADYAAYMAGIHIPALQVAALVAAAYSAKSAPHLSAPLALYAIRHVLATQPTINYALDWAWALIPAPLLSRDRKRMALGAALALALAIILSSPYARHVATFALYATATDSIPIAAFTYVAARGGPWRIAPLVTGPQAALSSSYAYVIAAAASATRASRSGTESRP